MFPTDAIPYYISIISVSSYNAIGFLKAFGYSGICGYYIVRNNIYTFQYCVTTTNLYMVSYSYWFRRINNITIFVCNMVKISIHN